MLKSARYILFMSTLLTFCFVDVFGLQGTKNNRPPESEYLSSIPPQAVPVYRLLKAIETSDVELFKSVWYSGTLKLWEAWGVKDYRATITVWRKSWRKELGRYKLRNLRYRYEGGESRGIIHISHQGNEPDGLFVIRENGVWKVRGGD
jgi:hypothetical protein